MRKAGGSHTSYWNEPEGRKIGSGGNFLIINAPPPLYPIYDALVLSPFFYLNPQLSKKNR